MISAFTYENVDTSWTPENEAELLIARMAKTISTAGRQTASATRRRSESHGYGRGHPRRDSGLIPRASGFRSDSIGTHLERYARWLRCAEINSVVLPAARSHLCEVARHTPEDFRFAVKMPRTITHERQLQHARAPLAAFLAQTRAWLKNEDRTLVQLPPSLSFDAASVIPFLDVVRRRYDGAVVCEPRHATWFEPPVTALLEEYESRGWRPIRRPAGSRHSRGLARPRLFSPARITAEVLVAV